MKNKDTIITEKILSYCEEIRAAHDMFGSKRETFFGETAESSVYRNAVSMPLQQIGELAKSYSDEFLKDNKGIPWNEIKGMRTFFAHEYGNMDKEKIWEASHLGVEELVNSLKTV